MTDHPAVMRGKSVGLREACLLLLGCGFALLMMDLANLAVVTGWAVVGLWVAAMLRGPRPSWLLSLACGAGLFVTTFWWPEEGWWRAAIILMWVGIGIMIVALAQTLIRRST